MAEQTQAGEILGTPAYMAPEQVLGRPVDGRSDIFSLGIILYEIATGKRPFGGEGLNAIFASITQSEPAEAVAVNPELPKALSDVIMTCLNKDPAKRYAHGRELASALRDVVGETKPPEAAEVPVTQKKRQGIMYAVVVMMTLCVVGGYFLMNRQAATKAVPAPVAAKLATLKVASTPAGAQVFIDGVLQGASPAEARVTAGTHEVRLSLPRYYEWEAQVDVKENEATPLDVKLMPMNGN